MGVAHHLILRILFRFFVIWRNWKFVKLLSCSQGWSNQFQNYESWSFTIFYTYHIVLDEVRLVKHVLTVKKTRESHFPNLVSELVVGSGEHEHIYVMSSCWKKICNWIFSCFLTFSVGIQFFSAATAFLLHKTSNAGNTTNEFITCFHEFCIYEYTIFSP